MNEKSIVIFFYMKINKFVPKIFVDKAPLTASLSPGFDLMEVGRDEVTLRTGKQANKRNIQFAHQALLALFGKLTACDTINLAVP